MPVVTITKPTADQIQRMIANKFMRKSNTVLLPTDQKFVVFAIPLAKTFDQGEADKENGDYPTLKTALGVASGGQDVHFLVDGHTDESIPVNTVVRLCVDVQTRIDNLPEPPSE